MADAAAAAKAKAVERVLARSPLKAAVDRATASRKFPLSAADIFDVLKTLVIEACSRVAPEALLDAPCDHPIHLAAVGYARQVICIEPWMTWMTCLAYNVAAIHLIRKTISGGISSEPPLKDIFHFSDPRPYLIVESAYSSLIKQVSIENATGDQCRKVASRLLKTAIIRGCLDVPSTDVVMYLEHQNKVAEDALAAFKMITPGPKNVGDLDDVPSRDLVSLAHPHITAVIGVRPQTKRDMKDLYAVLRRWISSVRKKPSSSSASSAPAIFVGLLESDRTRFGALADAKTDDAFVAALAALDLRELGRAMHRATMLGSAAIVDGRVTESRGIVEYERLMPFEQASCVVRGIAFAAMRLGNPRVERPRRAHNSESQL